MYVCINSKSTICTELKMIGTLTDSACKCILTLRVTTLLGMNISIVNIFVFK